MAKQALEGICTPQQRPMDVDLLLCLVQGQMTPGGFTKATDVTLDARERQ